MAYNPLRDPQSAYNNPKKGPRSSGAPGGGIPVSGPLSSEQEAWMDKGRKGGTAGRKACTVCKKRPADMTSHFRENAPDHGPIASSNEHAMNNFPGLKTISEGLGGLFNNRRR